MVNLPWSASGRRNSTDRRRSLGRIALPILSPGPPKTVEAVLSLFYDLKDRYLQSSGRDRTLALLQQYAPQDGWHISKAVLVGVGEFAASEHKYQRYKSTMQLIMFLDIVDNIKDEGKESIKLYAQERTFSELEREVLDFLNIEIIIDPQAQKLSGPGVFVFAPGCYIDVEMVSQCQPHQPSLFLGIKIDLMIEREQRWISNFRSDIEDGIRSEERHRKGSGDLMSFAERRLTHHLKRIDVLRKYQETHTEVTFPNYRGLHEERGYWLQVLKSDAPAHGSTCELCQDRDGRRFGYRHIGDEKFTSMPEWD